MTSDVTLVQENLLPARSMLTLTGVTGATGSPASVRIDYLYTSEFMGPIVRLIPGAARPGSATMSTTSILRNEQNEARETCYAT